MEESNRFDSTTAYGVGEYMTIACPPTGTCATVGIPRELIAIRAYLKWMDRCNACGHTSHGMDLQDWLEAESELREMWSAVCPRDLIQFAQTLDMRSLTPSQKCVEVRAYYKSLQVRAVTPEHARQLWYEAEQEERELLFADAFLNWLALGCRAPQHGNGACVPI